MKKTVLAAAFLAAALCLTGCGEEEEPYVPTVPILTTAPTTVPTTQAATVPPTTEAPTVPTTAETTLPEETVPPETEPEGVAGQIANVESVNVREGPSIHTKIVKKLRRGDPVRVLEGVTLDAVTWAHTEEGWICTDYLKLEGPVPPPKAAREGADVGVVFHTDTLNVRKEPSLEAEKVAVLNRNDVIPIYETRQVGGGTWGRTEEGWVGMDYVQIQALPEHTAKPGEPGSITGSPDYVPDISGENDFTAPSEGEYMENPVPNRD